VARFWPWPKTIYNAGKQVRFCPKTNPHPSPSARRPLNGNRKTNYLAQSEFRVRCVWLQVISVKWKPVYGPESELRETLSKLTPNGHHTQFQLPASCDCDNYVMTERLMMIGPGVYEPGNYVREPVVECPRLTLLDSELHAPCSTLLAPLLCYANLKL